MAFVFYGDFMNWTDFIASEEKKDYFKELMEFVKSEYERGKCHPDFDDIFNAYKYTAYDDVKCVIIGQDPYHNDGEAHGLAFSVYNGSITPSLRNIYKEMSTDLGVEVYQDGNLEYLTHEGVFLLNTILSVRHNEPLSFKNKGYEIFTSNTIKALNEREKPMVFILWGGEARKLKSLITNPHHLIIESAHPSPLGAYKGFFGSKPFSRCNEFLISNGINPIVWNKKERDLFNL